MTPKEKLQTAFEARINPHLAEAGFRYARSSFSFKRERGDFVQHISITLSHRNTTECISYWSSFNVSSPHLRKWFADRSIGEVPEYMGGCLDRNVPEWHGVGEDTHSNLITDDVTLDASLKDWWSRCYRAGLPYLDSISSWRGAAEDLLRRSANYDLAAELFLVANLPDSAIAVLEVGIEAIRREEALLAPSSNAHPVLVSKRKRQSAERDRLRRAFQEKIEGLRSHPH